MWRRIKKIYHYFNAIFCNILFLFPARKMIVIGVTGTDGKTTTVNLIYHILKTAGKNVSMISSLGAVINDKAIPMGFHITTPSPFTLQRLISKVVTTKGYLVLEVTSHAIDQYRTFGVKFAIAVLTNVTYEHLDYHKTYEKYVFTKTKLLKEAKTAVVNCEDASFSLVKEDLVNKKVVTYGLKKGAINLSNFKFKSNLSGDFNTYNILAAVSVCKSLGLTDEIIQKAISSFEPPVGRMDLVYNNKFKVMIDFAHTPNAFENILKHLRLSVSGKIIHVFGSASERDMSKRPLMGEISARYSDILVLTSEDPRKEDPQKIMDEIVSGISNSKSIILKIADRKKAIKKAIEMAGEDDLVVITGKAHEKSMNYGKGEEPWDEYKVVASILSELNLKNEKN